MNKGWIVKREALAAIEVKAEYIKNEVGTILVREVTPADAAKDEALREAFTIINEYAGANPEITSNDRKACVWLNKYGDPEGTRTNE